MQNILASLYLLWSSITGAPPQLPDITQATPQTEDARLVKRPKSEADKAPADKSESGRVVCQLKIDKSAGRRTFVALVTAKNELPQAGSYKLDVEKTGQPGGVHQRGDFELTSREPKRLAKVGMSVEANETLTGRLLVSIDGNETVCPVI